MALDAVSVKVGTASVQIDLSWVRNSAPAHLKHTLRGFRILERLNDRVAGEVVMRSTSPYPDCEI